MKVSELRIGNLLRDKVTKTELRVTKLTEQDIVTYVIDRSMFPLQDGWGIEPIPLTEEWLLKFGFEMINSSPINYKIYRLKDISFNVIKDSNIKLYDKIVYSEQYRYIESVHQLQNLYFALTGEELIFKQQEQ